MDLVRAAFSLPLFSLFLAAVVVAVILIFASRPQLALREAQGGSAELLRTVQARYRSERVVLVIAAILVIVVFAVENVLRGYVLHLGELLPWWRFATALFVAALGLGVVAAIEVRGAKPSEVPVVSGARRTWTSFGPRIGLIGAVVALVAIVATSIAAGLAAYADSRGDSAWLEIPIPNEEAIDPVRVHFYGWTYGVPVLICVALLAAVTWGVLHANAARPYIRPETVAAERDARRAVARDAVRVATAAMLLGLAGAWRLIASNGTGSELVIEGQNGGAPYEAIWRYAEVAAVAGWAAPVLEVLAFALLLLVAVRLRAPKVPAGAESDMADVEVVR
ncbi:hypothetical protein [Microbacterium croceum]|uniref:hypothetical protein n=1 Tax=Microbacterium croceum TaxID=2851645 RepID=UPI001FFD5832|nr:hypothetical protein [Microbacterium croceum]